MYLLIPRSFQIPYDYQYVYVGNQNSISLVSVSPWSDGEFGSVSPVPDEEFGFGLSWTRLVVWFRFLRAGGRVWFRSL